MADHLYHQVKKLQKDFNNLCNIRDHQKENNWIFSEALQLQQEPESPSLLREVWQSLHLEGWEVDTPVIAKAGILWLKSRSCSNCRFAITEKI